MKKIYVFFQTNIGLLVLLSVVYILTYGLSVNIGFNLGRFFQVFFAPLVILWFFRRKYKWTNRQLIVNSILLAFIWKFIIELWFGYKDGLALKLGQKPEYSTIELILRAPFYYLIVKPITSIL